MSVVVNGNMVVRDGNRIISFGSEVDYFNYLDYLENGLKVIRRDGRGYTFNDGSVLVDVSYKTDTVKRYVLHKRNKTFYDAKYTKKYVAVI